MSENLISLLPLYSSPEALLASETIPCRAIKVESKPIQFILKEMRRAVWVEGLFVNKNDLIHINRYKNSDGDYKNDFDENQFLHWIKAIETNTAICEMPNKKVGKGIFVPPTKKFPKGTFIPSSGIIKLSPTKEELETKNHCTALQDLNCSKRKIYGLIDPERMGGILDLVNHAPDEEEIANFQFKNSAIEKIVARANLKSVVKFYNGYAIAGIEAIDDIDGGEYGKQLLWSYAQPDEYLPRDEFLVDHTNLLLFDNRDEHNGEVLDINHYHLKVITIFLDIGEMMLRKVATLTRWELMKSAPESELVFTVEDPYSTTRSRALSSPIYYLFLQTYLKENPNADRVIIKVPN